MFPLRVAEIAQFGTQPAEGTAIGCRIRVREIARHKVRIDADLVRPDESVWVQITGWEDWRFYWPDRFRDVMRTRHAPRRRAVAAGGARRPRPGRLARAAGRLRPARLGDVLEWIELDPAECAANRARGETEPGLTLRIWGRIAAKEAARRLREAQGVSPVYPADLVIESDAHGRPVLRAGRPAWRNVAGDLDRPHRGRGRGPGGARSRARIGVDVERVRPLGAEFERRALLDPERRWLDAHHLARRPRRVGRAALVLQGGRGQGDRAGHDRRARHRARSRKPTAPPAGSS